jgi:hypothetical protein
MLLRSGVLWYLRCTTKTNACEKHCARDLVDCDFVAHIESFLFKPRLVTSRFSHSKTSLPLLGNEDLLVAVWLETKAGYRDVLIGGVGKVSAGVLGIQDTGGSGWHEV